ncbi:MAG: hypothetical protein IIC90_06230 [Chloroflexi bacterium]|nr:hypothetical protein [Chloroflexota bacterium]
MRTGLAAAVVLLAVAIVLAWQLAASAASGPEKPPGSMSLAIGGPSVVCNVAAASCGVLLGQEFTVTVSLDSLPLDPASQQPAAYAGLQTYVFYSGLTYKPTAVVADEIAWPESALPVRSPASPGGQERFVVHGDVTGTSPPLPPSSHTGAVLSLTLTCASEEAAFDIALLPYDPIARPLGAGVRPLDAETGELGATVAAPATGQRTLDLDGDGATPAETVDVADAWRVVCSPPTPTPPPNLPDLFVANMRIVPEIGGGCDLASTPLGIRVFVGNFGTADAGPFAVEVNGVQQSVDAGLALGDRVSLWFSGYLFGENTAIADAKLQVTESDEENNALTAFLAVPTLPLPCTPTPVPAVVGDVDCNGGVNSIDAALVLQLGAGLVDSLACEENADVNESGAVDAIDAALILQLVAGLIALLPV